MFFLKLSIIFLFIVYLIDNFAIFLGLFMSLALIQVMC